MSMTRGTLQQLHRLADVLVEDVLGASDSVIVQEAEEDGWSPRETAADLRELVDKAIARESSATGNAVAQHADPSPPSYRRLIRRLEAALAAGSELPESLASAFQTKSGISDATVKEMEAALEALGLLPDVDPNDRGSHK